MRVLRIAIYPPPGVGQPAMMPMRDRDIRVSIEAAEAAQRDSQPEVFVATEVFAMPDGSAESAAREAARRWLLRREVEERMAELFYWIASRIGPFKRQMTDPSKRPVVRMSAGLPLSTDDIAYALGQLAKHPAYTSDVRIEARSNEGSAIVVLDNGVVAVGSGPPAGGRGRYHGPN